MFSLQNRGGTTTASGLDDNADPSNSVAPALHAGEEEGTPQSQQADLQQQQEPAEDDTASYADRTQHPYGGGGDDAHMVQEDPSAVDASSSIFPAPPRDQYHKQHHYEGEEDENDQSYNQHGGGNGGGGEREKEDDDENGEGQVYTDYHGSPDHAEARNRRLQQQKAYDDIPVPPDDAAPHEVFAYYRKLIGVVQLVPPRHWRQIRFDLPANVAELRLFPQRRERIQDREPVRPSSVVVITLDGTMPENTTSAEYAAQMVQYIVDLLTYQNATSAITALRFVKKGTELSQMVITLGRDSRLAGRVLTELQSAGLRAHYGMVIFEHPPNATFQVVDYRRTLHDGKGISAEDVAFLLEPMRVTKTVDISVIEGFEPGVFYVPVKRPEAVYAFLWNYFCSYKFQSDLFRRYGVLVTQANCPHEFLKKGIPYAVQKRELEEKIKAELLRKGFEEREDEEGGGRTGGGAEDDNSDLDEDAVASGDVPAPAWVNAAADDIDIFSGLTKKAAAARLGGGGTISSGGASGELSTYITNNSSVAASSVMSAATTALADAGEITDIDALLKQYNAVAEVPKKTDAANRNKKGRDTAVDPPATTTTAAATVPAAAVAAAGNMGGQPGAPPDAPPRGGLPFNAMPGSYGVMDERHPPPPQHAMEGGYGGHGGYPGGADTYGPTPPHQQQQRYFPLPAGPYSGGNFYNNDGYYGGMGVGEDWMGPPPPASYHHHGYGGPGPSSSLGYPELMREGNVAAASTPASAYPPLVEESEDEEEMPLLVSGGGHGEQRQQHQQQQQQQQPLSHPPSSGAAAPYENGGLLSWSMDGAQTYQRGVGSRQDGWGGPAYYPQPPPPPQQQQQQQHSPSPPPTEHNDAGVGKDEPSSRHQMEETSVSAASGGAGILGDYNPSLDTPFYPNGGYNTHMGGGNSYGYPGPEPQGWDMQLQGGFDPNFHYGGGLENYSYQPGWAAPESGGGGFAPSQQVPPVMPPHVVEAAQIAADLEEKVRAAFPLSWAAATAESAAPLSLEESVEEDNSGKRGESSCVLTHIPAEAAAAPLPPPTAEMDDLFEFLHRNVSLVGRLLHKTTTTTVDQAREVSVYRERVARALLIGVTADHEAGAWAAAWVQQRADGNTNAVLTEVPTAGEEKPEQEAAEEAPVEYQLPALLPYLLRLPAGLDLSLLLALHYPRAFARRFLPYAPAFLIEESVVRVVLATTLRRDPAPSCPLLRNLLAHWYPLMTWLRDFVAVKAKVKEGGESPNATVKQLVSLLGNTMDAVLAGLTPEQREAGRGCSAAQKYVCVFVDEVTEGGELQLWKPEGALYRSLLRLYVAADSLDGAQLAQCILSPVTAVAAAAAAASGEAPSSTPLTLTREHLYYCQAVVSRSQTAPALSCAAAAFLGTFLRLLEAQATAEARTHAARDEASPAAATLGDAEALQLLTDGLAVLETAEAYTALRDAYLAIDGPVTRFETVLAHLSPATPPPTAPLHGATYREWYTNTNHQQKRNAAAARVAPIFYYQPPSRRHIPSNTTTTSSAAVNRWNRAGQPAVGGDGVSTQQQQQPAWASPAGPWTPPSGHGGQAPKRSGGLSTAAQHWRVEWGEKMRVYPATGTPFNAPLPEGWTCSLTRSAGRYTFIKTTANGSTSTHTHPVDNKEYLATPQAFLQEPGATAEATAMQVCERANVMHKEEALAANLPPPAELTQADVERWLSDQRHRNVFLDVATAELLGIRYGAAAERPAAAKRGRDGTNVAAAAAVPKPPMTPEGQQELLRRLIPDSYPALGAPYPALFHGWSVYLNSARGQYGFSGPHHSSSQPPLFVHPVTRRHYFVSPQAFVRQRKISFDVIAREAGVERPAVETWMEDQRSRDMAIDAAVMKIVPIHYPDAEKALAANAVATPENKSSSNTAGAAGSAEGKKGGHGGHRDRKRDRSPATTAPSSSSASRHRGGKEERRRRRRSDSYSEDSAYSDDDKNSREGSGARRRRGNRRNRSPRRRGGRRRR